MLYWKESPTLQNITWFLFILVKAPSSKQSSSCCSRKIYLALEVPKERHNSVASDIYLLGRMLKAVSCLIGFYEKVRVLVKKAIDVNPGDRLTVKEFLQQISTIMP